MDKITIEGGRRLRGDVEISGAKNSVLPILAATLLAEGESVIENVPDLRDVSTMIKILRTLRVHVAREKDKIYVKPARSLKHVAPYKLVSTMRASFCVLGPLVSRLGKAEVSIPGGCVIGARPIDLHLKGLKALGAQITIKHGYVNVSAHTLKGADIFLGGTCGSSVLATMNIMMAATLARGRTRIENAACEPEVVDLAHFLTKMGAHIKGAGSHLIEIQGVKKLKGVHHTVVPDRIETGTYMIAAAITRGDVMLHNVVPEHNNALIDKLTRSGIAIKKYKNKIHVQGKQRLHPIDVTTLPYPGFPTDLQAQITSLMCITPGISVITEKIYPDRFIHISELSRMGARVFLEGASAIITGVKKLSGAPVMASDLRASAALILAGLVAEGCTEVYRVYHLDRGYERLEEKLSALGAHIRREKE
ncbi:MAG: UDP-N-acetylglucosamine 1-carboxyvinyltransferase [Candidatus Omnitrophica bacterium]|nr:UDP-N-acetylglucosamine 1-carboxyvinyltransferase [Candidatus Omnitrophota bacterium]